MPLDNSSSQPKDTVNEPISFDIIVNGKSIISKFDVIKIGVEKSVNKLSKATISIAGGNSYLNTFEESENKDFIPGTSVEILLGYKQDNKLAFKGIIENHNISLKKGYSKKPWCSLLVLDCVDKAIKLKNSYTSDLYKDKKESEIITSLLSKVSGIKFKVKATNFKHPFFPKYNTTDWDFILDRAKQNGCVVLNSDNKIDVIEPKSNKSKSVLTIKNGESTISFDAQINSSSQLSSLKLNSWDFFSGETKKASAVEPKLDTNDTLSAKKISKETSPSSVEINIPQYTDTTELKIYADSFIKNSRLNRLTGTAKFKGVPDLKLGEIVTLDGFGSNFDGEIYITGISHQIEGGLFTTSLSFGLKNSYFKSSSFDKSKLVEPIHGVYIGTVKKNHSDPLNQGRIQILIPAFKKTGDGLWAQLSHFYTNTKAGSFFIPEVGTQVIVSFIANDPRYPVILNSLYTKKKSPYSTIKKENNLKAILSKSKLKVEFDDDEKKITISTPKTNSIVISEKTKDITIKDQNKNNIKLSEKGITLNSNKDISISSSGEVSITGQKGIILNGKSGDGVKISGSKINISAKTSASIKGGSKAELSASGQVNIKGAKVGIN